MQKTSLQMFLGGKFIDEVFLNYNGLYSEAERQWYHQGVITDLCEKHESLLHLFADEPVFCICAGPLSSESLLSFTPYTF